MKVYVTGLSGTGKSSVAKAFAAKGIASVDIDMMDLCHWENINTKKRVEWEPGSSKEWHLSHAWVCDIDGLKEFIAKQEDVVVVGCAANQDGYLHLFDKFFVLHAEPETMLARIHERTDNPFGKDPAEQWRIFHRQKEFEDEMVQKGAVLVDANQPLDRVVAAIGGVFKS